MNAEPTKKEKRSPARSYEDYDHATAEQHNTAEQFNWVKQNKLALFTSLLTGLAVALTAATFYQTRRQADIAQDTLSEIRSTSAQTDRAVEAAEKSANAAMAQVSLAQSNTVKQLRPYVWDKSNSTPEINQNGKISVTKMLTNTGLTAALNFQRITLTGLLTELPDGGAGLPYPTDDQILSTARTTYIAPGEQRKTSTIWEDPVSPEIWESLLTGTGPFLVEFGVLRYEDVFGSVHHTWFCMTWHGSSATSLNCPRGNRID